MARLRNCRPELVGSEVNAIRAMAGMNPLPITDTPAPERPAFPLALTKPAICLQWGPAGSMVSLSVPAGTSMSSALGLSACLLDTVRGLAHEALDDSGNAAGSTRWAITWLADIAHNLVAAACHEIEMHEYALREDGEQLGSDGP